ncbi:MAG: DUF59 domain-containing protein [Nitrospirae bacterium]|nr:DUF59 domain-containing protein [Nitrospirota bacterium]
MSVRISQTLGGTFTVITDSGYMVRIAAKDADALGPEYMGSAGSSPEAKPAGSLEEQVWEQLKTCYDPEIPANIVDLGLIYECNIAAAPEGGSRIDIKMSLTAPGCGMGDILKGDIETKLGSLDGVKAVSVELILDPPWTPDRMSEAARLQLGF